MRLASTFFRRSRTLGVLSALVVCALLAAAAATPAMAEFGLQKFDLTFENEDGTPATQAGSHPYDMTSAFELNYTGSPFAATLDGELKDMIITAFPGLAGSAQAVPQCQLADFLTYDYSGGIAEPGCPANTALGVAYGDVNAPIFFVPGSVFSLDPPPGVTAELAFVVLGAVIKIDVGLKQGGDYNVTATLPSMTQAVSVYGGEMTLWGTPGDPGHDPYRGRCLKIAPEVFTLEYQSDGICPANVIPQPLLTMPTACTGPLQTTYVTDSWTEPGKFVSGGVFMHDNTEPPNPIGFDGCGKLSFKPSVEAKATTDQAETGTGLDFNVDFAQEGLTNPEGLAESEAQKAVVTLPEGMTINPSVGEGLSVCTKSDLARETMDSEPGEGCPNASKIGTLRVETPLVDEAIEGSAYLAQQDDPATAEPGAENPFDSLIALYLVMRNPNLGALVKLPMKVEPSADTGRLVATLDDVPQVPFTHFNFHFREGARAALVTPNTCGAHTTEAKFWPRSDPANPRTVFSDFEISSGKAGGACPSNGVPPFDPDFEAGSINNNAASFSPFDMRITREDGEQDMTKFSAILPPGEVGSLAGVDKCPDSAIAIAKAKQGREELASPSCPANSLIGHTLAGAGVGSALTYVKGQVYLGGAYHGDPLSVIAITPAVAGPFDAGTVVVQLALTLNPKTAEVEVDGANSDPIPHIIKGIVLKLRDLRVNVDRPNFTLNPTSCDESSARATLFGSFLNVLDPADDKPVNLSTRYQAANCLNLGFKPTLALNLKGGTKRGGHPGLRAIYTPRKGDANVKGLVVRLPRSAFLDQAHIKTICTRVQFASDSCPKASQYGYIKAYTPLLETPLEGPAYLRSSNHKLPDLVFDLHGLVDIEVSTRIDSKAGGIRATVEDAPDAPLSKVDLRMQGAKKGLIINSRNLCGHVSKANVTFTGHNGKEHSSHPVMKADCGGKRKR